MPEKEGVEYRFTFIKRAPDTGLLDVEYEENSVGGWTGHELSPPQLATQDLYDAFDKITPHVAAALRLKADGTKALRLREVHFERTKSEEFVKLVATQEVADADGVATLRLPRMLRRDGLKRVIDDLEFEAIGFVNGERGQLVLPLKEKKEGEGDDGEDPDLFDGDDDDDEDLGEEGKEGDDPQGDDAG